MKNVLEILVMVLLIVAMIITLVRYFGAGEGAKNSKDILAVAALGVSLIAILLRRL